MSSNRPPDKLPAGVSFHALVPAAGRGERFGGDLPKQFVAVAGRPLLAWTLDRLLATAAASVVVALPAEELEECRARLPADERVRLVVGGSTRQASVASALEASPAGPDDLVAVHDGARAAVDLGDFERTVAAARLARGAVLGRAMTDTVKRVAADRIVGTADRRELFLAETPQVFPRSLLERALAAARRDRFLGTDEASLVERLEEDEGAGIVAVSAERPNPKLTYESDLSLLERLLGGESGT
jgi:2-C-methyl-D-erythritol 4-phosphate cytidylyltransferase